MIIKGKVRKAICLKLLFFFGYLSGCSIIDSIFLVTKSRNLSPNPDFLFHTILQFPEIQLSHLQET
jgi:hypothetical protein